MKLLIQKHPLKTMLIPKHIAVDANFYLPILIEILLKDCRARGWG